MGKTYTITRFFRTRGKIIWEILCNFIGYKIRDRNSQISCEVGPVEKGIDIIILGGRFMVEHLITFKGNEIEVKQYICNPKSIILYDETLLDEEPMVWTGSLIATKVPNSEEIKELV
jgi:hypothetical protein